MIEKRILLIEDDEDHAELIGDVLKEDNTKEIKTEVTLKKDGQEAIEQTHKLTKMLAVNKL